MLTWLLSVPGASKTVLEARIPYGGGKSMAEILAREPETYACTLTAVEMARAAYRQAAHLSEFGVPILGVSCTCALATDRVKKGDHKVGRPGDDEPMYGGVSWCIQLKGEAVERKTLFPALGCDPAACRARGGSCQAVWECGCGHRWLLTVAVRAQIYVAVHNGHSTQAARLHLAKARCLP